MASQYTALSVPVGNCSFVTRTAVWVHCAGIRLSLEHHRPPARLTRGIGRRQGPLCVQGIKRIPRSELRAEEAPSPSLTARHRGIATMAARNTCLPRNNKSGPVQSDGDWVPPMNPFRRWRDERSEGQRTRHRPLNGRFCDEAKPCASRPAP